MNGNGYETLKPVIVAAAIERLHERGEEFTPTFFHHVSRWFDQSPGIEEFDEPVQEYVRHWIDVMWETKTTYEHPLERQQRLGDRVRSPRTLTDIERKMRQGFPRTNRPPPEE